MSTASVTPGPTWASIGTGPMYVENVGPGTAHLHFGGVLPADNTLDFIGLGAGMHRDYGGTDTVYARTPNATKLKTVT